MRLLNKIFGSKCINGLAHIWRAIDRKGDAGNVERLMVCDRCGEKEWRMI